MRLVPIEFLLAQEVSAVTIYRKGVFKAADESDAPINRTPPADYTPPPENIVTIFECQLTSNCEHEWADQCNASSDETYCVKCGRSLMAVAMMEMP